MELGTDGLEARICRLEATVEAAMRDGRANEWAKAKNQLASLYGRRLQGNRADNIELAIASCQDSLLVRDRATLPEEWANTQHNLGTAYRVRVRGDRAENIERAIGCYENALTVRTREETPQQWGATQHNLGIAYATRIRGSRRDNLERALVHFELALSVRNRGRVPKEWGNTQHCLGETLRHRIAGDRSDNVEAAIGSFRRALTVRTRHDFPRAWASTMNNIGLAYAQRRRGDPALNLERALECYAAALEVRTRTDLPLDWAATQYALGSAYRRRLDGERGLNLERAIACYRRALSVYHRASFPDDWARTQCALGVVYGDRVRGARAENLERAIGFYSAALEVHTQVANPTLWANLQHNVGAAYAARDDGDRLQNLDIARRCLLQAMTVREAMPADCLATARGLAQVFRSLGEWTDAANFYRRAIDASAVLYRSSVLDVSRRSELGSIKGLHLEAAEAVAQASLRASATAERDAGLQESVVIMESGRAQALRQTLDRDSAELSELARLHPLLYRQFEQAAQRLRELEAADRELNSDDEPHSSDPGRQTRNTTHIARREQEVARANELLEAREALDVAAEAIRQQDAYGDLLAEPTFARITDSLAQDSALAYVGVVSSRPVVLLVHQRDAPSPVAELLALQTGSGKSTSEIRPTLERSSAGLEVEIAGFVSQIADGARLFDVLASGLETLGSSILGPLASRVRQLGLLELVLIPCGELALLPLHGITYIIDAQEPRCLLQEVDVAWAPSAVALHSARKQLSGRPAMASPDLVGVSNPNAVSRPLRYADAELTSISALFADPKVHRAKQGTRSWLKEASHDVTYVHLACHGTFAPESPLDSALSLADGPLTIREIQNQRLFATVRLVVASACQSATTEVALLPDEAIGFPAALLGAGAAAVVASLWKIDDLPTALLMIKFYELMLGNGGSQLGSQPPGKALRSAQLWLAQATVEELAAYIDAHHEISDNPLRYLTNKTSRPFANPFYWAAFQFIGA